MEVGKIADMIAVSGDPLEDVTLLNDATNVRMVVQSRKAVRESRLDEID